MINEFIIETEDGEDIQDWHEEATDDSIVQPKVLATFNQNNLCIETISEKTLSELNSTSISEEFQNAERYTDPKDSVHSSDLVPSVLEVTDVATKTYRVSSVALKRSPMMMCFINHAPVPIILKQKQRKCYWWRNM